MKDSPHTISVLPILTTDWGGYTKRSNDKTSVVCGKYA
jgi:hypothetical protein